MTEDELKAIEARLQSLPFNVLVESGLLRPDSFALISEVRRLQGDLAICAASSELAQSEVRRLREEVDQQRRAAMAIATAFGHGGL